MHPEQTQAKEHLILAAARKRFAYYGFSKVTMDEIASDVGLAKPSLYYYFPTKEGLFRAVIAHEQGKFVADIETMLSRAAGSGEKLRALIDLRVRLFRELVNLSALGVDSWAEVSSLFKDLFRNLEEQELKFLGAILAAGNDAGELDVANPQQTAKLILHALHGLRLRAIHADRGPHVTDGAYADLKRDSDHLIELLLNGMQRPSSH
ncbi:MAG TPA: TetR/AcrR family transcriptional regulator [Bacteroidota bacterium]|nr:TetR/AcrR family transcriptional regulator [Bacteroidota bacterium]